MDLNPLLAAPAVIQLHAGAALAALLLGGTQLALPKGTSRHRAMGWTWVALMTAVAGSSLVIGRERMFGPWSWIHGLSIFTLIMLPLAVLFVRRGRISGHAGTMISLFIGALVITGAFTLLPGRIMSKVFFGG
jgi:uncharacterized membrane protein